MATMIVLLHVPIAMALAWYYFRHHTVARPPIGVIDLTDVGVMMVSIVVLPYLYLVAPSWLIAGLLGLGALGLVQITLEPLVQPPWAGWLVTFALVVADGGSAWLLGTASVAHQVINNIVMLIIVVGITNLWVQSGIQARAVALLGGMLTLYDFVSTTQLPLMTELFQRLAGMPFATQVVWPGDFSATSSSIGLGDLLFAALFPLVMHKAFGRRAATLAFVLGFSACAGLDAALWLTGTDRIFPAMVVLGPLMVAQYLFWMHRRRRERATWEYLAAEPRSIARVSRNSTFS
jgi:hypothetical protein